MAYGVNWNNTEAKQNEEDVPNAKKNHLELISALVQLLKEQQAGMEKQRLDVEELKEKIREMEWQLNKLSPVTACPG